MQNVARRAALALSVITASVALATPANAEVRLKNADTSQGEFFLGVLGNPCGSQGCFINHGKPIVVWQMSFDDQLWQATAPGFGVLKNHFNNQQGFSMCAGVAGNPQQQQEQGRPLVLWECLDSAADQKWNAVPAASIGTAPGAPFPGCFVFTNSNSGQVMGVAGGKVKNSTAVIQWPFFFGNPGEKTGWHADQFWCPQ